MLLTDKAIFCLTGYGPSFGIGIWGDLETNEPFNKEYNCRSYVNSSSYGIKLDPQGNNMLTNEPSQKFLNYNVSSFTISELEVWEVNEAELLSQ